MVLLGVKFMVTCGEGFYHLEQSPNAKTALSTVIMKMLKIKKTLWDKNKIKEKKQAASLFCNVVEKLAGKNYAKTE